jgi:phosphoglycolate phosphatase-like HAD superfamily hydrolase
MQEAKVDKDGYLVDAESLYRSRLLDVLERIARAQEGMVSIAMEARGARMELSKKLQEKLQQPFEGK